MSESDAIRCSGADGERRADESGVQSTSPAAILLALAEQWERNAKYMRQRKLLANHHACGLADA